MHTRVQTLMVPDDYPLLYGVYDARDHEAYNELLSMGEHTYLAHKEKEKYSNSLIGRVVAKHAIATYFKNVHGIDVVLSDIEIVSKVGERPRCNIYGCDSKIILPHVSLAHSGGHAVALAVDAHTSHGVGVDIESVREWKEETLRGFLNEHEYNSCVCDGEISSFKATLYWCLKEAYLKACGTGLRIHPRDVFIYINDNDMSKITIEIQGKIESAQIAWTQGEEGYIITSVIL